MAREEPCPNEAAGRVRSSSEDESARGDALRSSRRACTRTRGYDLVWGGGVWEIGHEGLQITVHLGTKADAIALHVCAVSCCCRTRAPRCAVRAHCAARRLGYDALYEASHLRARSPARMASRARVQLILGSDLRAAAAPRACSTAATTATMCRPSSDILYFAFDVQSGQSLIAAAAAAAAARAAAKAAATVAARRRRRGGGLWRGHRRAITASPLAWSASPLGAPSSTASRRRSAGDAPHRCPFFRRGLVLPSRGTPSS